MEHKLVEITKLDIVYMRALATLYLRSYLAVCEQLLLVRGLYEYLAARTVDIEAGFSYSLVLECLTRATARDVDQEVHALVFSLPGETILGDTIAVMHNSNNFIPQISTPTHASALSAATTATAAATPTTIVT